MDLLGVVEAARRHWLLILGGVLVGILLAVAVTFRTAETADGRPRVVMRAQGVYDVRIRLMIVDSDFGLGRVDAVGVTDTFGRTIYLAPTYAYLITSDQVLHRVADKVGRLRESVDAKAQKDSPVINVTVRGTDPERVVLVANEVANAFSEYLKQQQDQRHVPENGRTAIDVLSEPRTPAPSRTGSLQYAALIMLSPAVACLGFAMAIESVRRAKSA